MNSLVLLITGGKVHHLMMQVMWSFVLSGRLEKYAENLNVGSRSQFGHSRRVFYQSLSSSLLVSTFSLSRLLNVRASSSHTLLPAAFELTQALSDDSQDVLLVLSLSGRAWEVFHRGSVGSACCSHVMTCYRLKHIREEVSVPDGRREDCSLLQAKNWVYDIWPNSDPTIDRH